MSIMINPIDRSDDFLRALSAHHGAATDERPLVRLRSRSNDNDNENGQKENDMESDEFMRQCEAVGAHIAEQLDMVERVSARYADFSGYHTGMSDAERDVVDGSLSKGLSSALRSIDELKERALGRRGRNDKDDAAGEEEMSSSFGVHKLGVVVMLNDRLQEVSGKAEGLRGWRIKQAVKEREMKKRVHVDEAVKREFDEERQQQRQQQRQQPQEDGEDEDEDFVLMEQLEQENLSLVSELVQTRERVKQTESTIQTIANMNQLFASKVVQQAKDIETVYDLAREASTLVNRGNRELNKMHRRGPVLQYVVAVILIFLALTLLVLEWIGRRRF